MFIEMIENNWGGEGWFKTMVMGFTELPQGRKSFCRNYIISHAKVNTPRHNREKHLLFLANQCTCLVFEHTNTRWGILFCFNLRCQNITHFTQPLSAHFSSMSCLKTKRVEKGWLANSNKPTVLRPQERYGLVWTYIYWESIHLSFH